MKSLIRRLRTVKRRRATLKRHFDIIRAFEDLEESCVPSYCHRNPAAAGVAWLRLLIAAGLWQRHAKTGPVLDFGAASGELHHFLESSAPYHFIEENDSLAASLKNFIPGAQRQDLKSLPARYYAAIFALDSLEHNDDVASLVERLVPALAPNGIVILSGPTENALYRLGRRIAGFQGHYHKVNIRDVERSCANLLVRVTHKTVPFGVPLFRISVWRSDKM